MSAAALTLDGVSVRYGDFPAVSDARLALAPGRTLALIGESGCGKSTLALAVARLLPPGAAITAGTVRVGDVDVSALAGSELRRMRGRLVGYIAQDALAALNPVARAGRQVAEAFEQAGLRRREAAAKAVALLRRLGIQDAERVCRRYPHELSGGMRQRVMIAIALALAPPLLIADEPTTAVDVTVQAEILSLVRELQRERELTLVWITHDMGVVAEIADDVAVMYAGRIVEHAPADSLFSGAGHPYTQALLRSVRDGAGGAPKRPFATIPGQPPTGELLAGCPFNPRCAHALPHCREDVPVPVAVGTRHVAACHLLVARV